MFTGKERDNLRKIRDTLRLGMSREELIELLGPPTVTKSLEEILSNKKFVVFDGSESGISGAECAIWDRPEGLYQLVIKEQKLTKIYSCPDAVKKRQILDSHGRSFFEVAKSGDLSGIKEILEKGEDVDVRDNGGNTPLLIAVCFGHMEAVKLLISHGADVNAVCEGGYTPHKMAERTGEGQIEVLLLKHGARHYLDM